MARRPFQHFHADGCVRPGIAFNFGDQPGKPAVLVAGNRVVEAHRMALWMHDQRLFACERHFHRPLQQVGKKRRVPLNREILLAAERAARLHLDDLHPSLGDAQNGRDLAPVLIGALSLGKNLDLFFSILPDWLGEGAFGFQVSVLHTLRRVNAFGKISGIPDRALCIAALKDGLR